MKMILLMLAFVYTSAAGDLPNVLANGTGRYVFGQVSAGLFMLDTQTGRLWQITVDEKTKQRAFVPCLYSLAGGSFGLQPMDSEKEMEAAAKTH